MPLVWAHTNDLRLLGAEVEVRAQSRYDMARRWANALINGAATVTFLAGRLATSSIYVTPTAITPPETMVARDIMARQRLVRAGVRMAWLTLAALAGTPVYEVAQHAVAVCSSLRSERDQAPLSVLPGYEGALRVGVTDIRSLIDKPTAERVAHTSLEALAARALRENAELTEALLEDRSNFSEYLREWADQVQMPPMAEIPEGLLASTPNMADERLDELSFPPDYEPPKLAWVPRMPRQREISQAVCPRRAADLMPASTWRRVERWIQAALLDLICIRDHGEQCERKRPGVLVIGQSELHPWARGTVWDFRNASSECGKPLDFHAPLQHTLNVEYLQKRLHDYPNQQLLSFLVQGARPLADVELQTVLVPHLMSLSKGFPSVVKEIKRMASPDLNWYSLHADIPFWPIYSLGEGCVPRKLENRWRRCEEGGGPRKDVFDGAGIRPTTRVVGVSADASAASQRRGQALSAGEQGHQMASATPTTARSCHEGVVGFEASRLRDARARVLVWR